MSVPKQTTKTEKVYLQDIEKCEKKILKTWFELLKNIYNRYMAVVKGVEDTLGWDVITRLGLHVHLINETCLKIIHSDIMDGSSQDLQMAKKQVMTIVHFLRTVAGIEYDIFKAEYISAQNPSIGLMYSEELEQLRKNVDLDRDEFKASEEEAEKLRYEAYELKNALLRNKDREWYKSLVVKTGPSTTPLQQPHTSTESAGSTKGSAKNDRATICTKIIIDARKRMIKKLLKKFKDIHAELKDISEMSVGASKGEVLQLWPEDRDVARSLARHDRYNNLPKQIADEKLAEMIEDMTHGVRELAIDYENFYQAFEKYMLQTIETKRTTNTHTRLEHTLESMRTCKVCKDADIKLFDARIASEQQTITRFTNEMQKDRGAKKSAQMLQDSKEQREKLIKEMIKIEQKRCEVTGCRCLERDREANLLVPGSGTRKRYMADRSKVLEVLNGAKPCKVAREEMDALKEKIFERHQELSDLEKVMANMGVD